MKPDTRYAKTLDGVHIAYQVIGHGPPDLLVSSWALCVEHVWRWEFIAGTLRRWATFARVLLFDRRGTGASDHIVQGSGLLPLETRMDDIRAVMDAAGSDRAILLGIEDGFFLAAMFAATYPERTTALIAYGAGARTTRAPDYPWGLSEREMEDDLAGIDRAWGTRELARHWLGYVSPDHTSDEERVERFADWMRSIGGPGDAAALYRVDRDTDIRDLLPAIRVPTLVLHRMEDQSTPVEGARILADSIPGARLVELPGRAHGWAGPETADLHEELERFVGDLRREEAELDRVLATVLFTDIVGSTEKAAAVGDRQWGALLEAHHGIIRGLLARYRGTEVDTAGDGFFATFDGPARAVRCALATIDAVASLGIEVRAGVHTGEVETIDGKVGGLAVSIGARIGALAGPSELLASSTVKDLTAGSGLRFEERGQRELKGVPGSWHTYAARAD
jgi:class 3 adenylate cyclase